MTDTTTPTIETVVDTYLGMFAQADPTEAIDVAFAPGARFVDPLLDVTGHEALGETVAMVQQQYPGHRFVRSSGIDEHHSIVRYSWDLLAPDGGAVLTGTDVAAVGDDGRLTIVAGFFGDVPAMDAA